MNRYTWNGQSVFHMQPAEQFNAAVAELPKAELEDIYVATGKNGEGKPKRFGALKNFKAVKVIDSKGKALRVYCPSTRYQVVQTADAFRPIIEGLTQAGVHDWKFTIVADHRRAYANIFAGDNKAADSVEIGFRIANSFDGSQALTYGFKMQHKTKTLELVGYRQVCSNGMKVKVPLDEAEFIKEEVVTRIKELMKQQTRLLHTTNVHAKIELLQHVVEAMALLKDPVNVYIKKAKKWLIDDEEKLEKLIKAHVGERFRQRVMQQYAREEDQTIWSLYNAMTYVSSHDRSLKMTARETLMDKAADMLLVEVAHGGQKR